MKKRPFMASGGGPSEISQRELGLLQSQAFDRRVGGSEVFVKRLDLYGKLNGHRGCVNTVSFSPTGDLLVSGSDDTEVMIWNWGAKNKKVAYPSGHSDNVFQAHIMPFSDDRTIITSAADGQVRLGQITEKDHVKSKLLGTHSGRVHNLAIEPGSPYIFYSCGEDGLVQHFDLRSNSSAKLFLCSSFSDNRQPIQLNTIVIDPRNPNYFSVGGFDQYARVYDIRNCQVDASVNSDRPVNTFCPHHLISSDNVHVTGLVFSITSELLVSYNDELVYLFQKDMGLGPSPQSNPCDDDSLKPQVYSGHRNLQTVKGVSFFGPSDEYVASGSDCGHVFIWRKKGGELIRMMVGDKRIVNCIEPHPYFPFLATSGLDKNVKLWTPSANNRVAPLPKNAAEIMAANKRGRESRTRITLSPDVIMHVLRLQRRHLAYVEQRPSSPDGESDDDDNEGDAFIVGLSNSDDAASEEGSPGDPRECNIC